MNRKFFALSVILMAVTFSLVQTTTVFAAAKSITFKVTMDNSDKMKNPWIGNMTAPGGCTQFWYQPPPSPSWKWENNGSNAKPFSLLLNYKLYQNGAWVDATAHGYVAVDPTVMTGDATVNIVLKKCNLAKGNDVGAVFSVSGPSGVSKADCAQVPACSNFQ